jgi:membrane-associated HD superfamily phosphohydrolase
MLADSTEAAIRSAGAQISSYRDLQETVSEVVDSKLAGLQLEEVPFTLRDLSVIKGVFVEVLRSMYHTRQIREIDETAQELSPQEG